MSTTSHGLAVLALLSIVPAGVGAQEDNELDRFMARVLQQQGENAARRLDYVFDERAEGRMTGPDGDMLIPRLLGTRVMVSSCAVRHARRSRRRRGALGRSTWVGSDGTRTRLSGP